MTTQIGSGGPEAPRPPEVEEWRDKKRYLWLMGLIAPTALVVMLPLIWGMNQLGWHAAAQVPLWIGPILLYVLLPLLDLRFGPDGQNPPDEVTDRLENDKYYRYCTYIYIPFQYLSVVLGAYLFTAANLSWLGFDGALSWAGKLGVALSVGVLGGVGINTAHEMGHKKDSLERWLSKITLAQTCYGHFYIEHNRGHHVRVSTPEDPASARFGETLWEFLPRSVIGGLRSAVHLEAQRLRRLGVSPWNPMTYLRNDVLNAWLMSVVLWGGLIAVFGPALIPFVIIQAVFGFSLLEAVNYLEHYGLLRQKSANGRYERCAPGAQLELRPHRHQPVPLPPAATQRSPRQPHSPLSDTAEHGGCAQPAQWVCIDDLADLLPAVVAQGNGSPGAGALRRRYHSG